MPRASSKRAGLKAVIEPINAYDIPGFYLNRTAQALSVMDEVGAPNLFLQYDIYHAQRSEGELAATMQKHLARIAHMQLADNPGRNEPGTRRDQLPVPVRAHRPHRLHRLHRLRVQAGRLDRGRARLVRQRPCLLPSAPGNNAAFDALGALVQTSAFHLHLSAVMTTPQNIGFIGLGIMGAPMAGHLAKAGHQPVRDDAQHRAATRSSRPARPSAPSAKSVAEQADIVFVMVPDTPDVQKVLFADDGVAAGLTKGKTVVDMSSISPIETKEFAKRINALGCDYLDAPVSGGEVGAKAGSLTIMVGGPEATFEQVKPLFELMGKNITLVGGNGDGQTCKVANQIIVALNIEAVGEALVFASQGRRRPGQGAAGADGRLRGRRASSKCTASG